MHHPHRIAAALMTAVIAISTWLCSLAADAREFTPDRPDYIFSGDGEVFMI